MKLKNLYNCILILIVFTFTNLVNSQNRNQSTPENIHLENKLNEIHQKELTNYFQQLKTAGTAIDSAAVFNDITNLYLESSYYLKVSKYDSVIYYADKSLK